MSQQEEGCTYECVLESTQRWLSRARHLNLDTTVLKLQSWAGPFFFFNFTQTSIPLIMSDYEDEGPNDDIG
jgi:hypothetical protein